MTAKYVPSWFLLHFHCWLLQYLYLRCCQLPVKLNGCSRCSVLPRCWQRPISWNAFLSSQIVKARSLWPSTLNVLLGFTQLWYLAPVQFAWCLLWSIFLQGHLMRSSQFYTWFLGVSLSFFGYKESCLTMYSYACSNSTCSKGHALCWPFIPQGSTVRVQRCLANNISWFQLDFNLNTYVHY